MNRSVLCAIDAHDLARGVDAVGHRSEPAWKRELPEPAAGQQKRAVEAVVAAGGVPAAHDVSLDVHAERPGVQGARNVDRLVASLPQHEPVRDTVRVDGATNDPRDAVAHCDGDVGVRDAEVPIAAPIEQETVDSAVVATQVEADDPSGIINAAGRGQPAARRIDGREAAAPEKVATKGAMSV